MSLFFCNAAFGPPLAARFILCGCGQRNGLGDSSVSLSRTELDSSGNHSNLNAFTLFKVSSPLPFLSLGDVVKIIARVVGS